MPNAPLDTKKAGNILDAVFKKKYALNFPLWVYLAALGAMNAVGTFLHF